MITVFEMYKDTNGDHAILIGDYETRYEAQPVYDEILLRAETSGKEGHGAYMLSDDGTFYHIKRYRYEGGIYEAGNDNSGVQDNT